MNKSVLVIAAFSAVLFAGSIASAEEAYGPPPPDDAMQADSQGPRDFERGDRGQRGERMGGREMGMKGAKGMMGMGLHHQTVVATSDGGVVILSGGKLAKYDAGLNLVKEIELKKDKAPAAPGPAPAAPQNEMPDAPAAEMPAPDAAAEEAPAAS